MTFPGLFSPAFDGSGILGHRRCLPDVMEGTDFGDEPWNANLSVDAEAFIS
jgi:hypothetical protein